MTRAQESSDPRESFVSDPFAMCVRCRQYTPEAPTGALGRLRRQNLCRKNRNALCNHRMTLYQRPSRSDVSACWQRGDRLALL
jgi:hypothetical protein